MMRQAWSQNESPLSSQTVQTGPSALAGASTWTNPLVDSGTVSIPTSRLVLDSLLPDFAERYRAARAQGIRVLINPFDVVYRLGWDPNQAFLLEVLENASDEIEVPELRDDEGFDLLGRYLFDAAFRAMRCTRGKGAVLEAATLLWFVQRGCSLHTRYTQGQVASYEDKLIGQAFRSNEEGLSAFAIISSSTRCVLSPEHPWLQYLVPDLETTLSECA